MPSMPPARHGENTTLRRSLAPAWLRPLTTSISGHDIARQLGNSADDMPAVKQSAILIALAGSPEHGSASAHERRPADARVLLTHRSPDMRTHSGQIAFPGGRLEHGDRNVVDGALREAWEETGIDRRAVAPLVQLAPLHVRTRAYPIHPVIAHWHTEVPVWPASELETDDVFTVPIAHLVDPNNRMMLGFDGWSGPAFEYDGYVIWGFTAGVLSAVLASAGWEEPWDKVTVQPLRPVIAASRNNERAL